MNSNNKNSLILAGSLILLLIVIVVARERLMVGIENKRVADYKSTTERNVISELKSMATTKELLKVMDTNNSMAVHQALDYLASKESNRAKYESLKLYAAASLINLDRSAGAKYYMDIANDTSNSNITRAYAMTQITQYSSGYSDNNLLDIFFTNDSEYKKLTPNEKKLAINKKIIDLYPFGIASARVARYELLNNPSTSTAQDMYNRYIEDINLNISSFSGRDGLSHFIPSTYLNTAYFLREAEKYGVSNREEIRSYFDKAFSFSLASQNMVTAEFTLLSYADYLLKINQTQDAESVISKLLTISTSDMVKNETKNGLVNYPSLNKFSKSGSELANQVKAKYSK
jgi:hypothetical protein